MASELQRVAQALVECLDEVPQIVEYLQRLAQRCRDNAGYIADISNHPAARNAALELDMAARCCDDAAHLLSLAEVQARAWAMEMVGGGRTVGPAGGSGRRPAASAGRTSSAERGSGNDQADAGDSPQHQPAPRPRISDEQARELQRRLPVRQDSFGKRDKTRGLWLDDDGQEHDLVSGETDYYQQVKQFLRDLDIGPDRGELMVPSHVEAKFAMFMRLHERKHETIVVNQVPCTGKWGCEELLGRILPAGSTLTVLGPNNFKQTYPKPPTRGTEPA